MNVLMINPTHPATPHISAVRAWRFSQELACRSHRVVLLTGDSTGTKSPVAALESHDWSQPFVEVCGLTPTKNVTPSTSAAIRRATTAVRLLAQGGRQGQWVKAAVRAARRLRPAFEPDVVWGTFGMLEAAMAAKRIAGDARCPWVLDAKDNWESLVPRGMRNLMMWRLKGWAAMTANSQLTADLAMKWQRTTPSVIYSGIEPEFFSSGSGDEDRPARFSVNLIGSLYFPDKLGDCLEGFKAWFESLALDQQRLVTINYLGADVELMTATASRHWPQMPLHVPGYLHVTAMARLCKAAAANAYIANATTFHHKLLELLACGRPVIAFPSERLESIQLASTLGGGLVVADSPEAMASILKGLHTSWLAGTLPAPRSDVARELSWPAQADKLEQVLVRVVNGPV